MIYQSSQKDTIHKSRFSLSLHSNSPISSDILKRHSFHQDKKVFPMMDNNDVSTTTATTINTTKTIKCRTLVESGIMNNNLEQLPPPTQQHWEKIESYYIDRLDSLSKEVETCILQNTKLSAARDELLQEILKLHQKSIELNKKNESLSRLIAEKENHISAFMYNDNQQQQARPVIGVTLVDQPYTLFPPAEESSTSSSPSASNNSATIIPPTTNTANNIKSSLSATTIKSQPGIFRQLSLRLSGRKRRQQDDNSNNTTASLHISKPVNATNNNNNNNAAAAVVPIISSSEPLLLHPAAVVTLSEEEPYNNKRKKNLIFGNDLIQQARSENSVIPLVVLKCIREVESRGLSVEGIYRKSGTLGQVKELQDAFDENKNPKLSRYQDINVITSLLKLYFRELSTPLIPNEFILSPSLTIQDRLKKTYDLLHNMPVELYYTIKFLVQHLKKIHQNHSMNRMPSNNLAVVFGPTLMRFTITGNEQQMLDMINTVDFIIVHSHDLFANYNSC